MFSRSSDSGPLASRAAWSALAVLLLTSVHHAYGAYIYETPWRYHVVLLSAGAALAIVMARALLRLRTRGAGSVATWSLFAVSVLVVPVLLIGAYEGVYNHVLKNVLYFGGTSRTLLTRLFPPPRYELPNDLLFEVTGVLQVVPAALAAWYLYRLIRPRRGSSRRIRDALPCRLGARPTRSRTHAASPLVFRSPSVRLDCRFHSHQEPTCARFSRSRPSR